MLSQKKKESSVPNKEKRECVIQRKERKIESFHFCFIVFDQKSEYN